jgi:archaellin
MGFDTLDRLVLVAAIGAVVAIPTTALLTYRLSPDA